MGIRQKKLEAGWTLLFIDEAGYSLTSNRRRTWAPRGIVPVMRHSFRSWRKLSAQSAITISPSREIGLVWRLRPGKTVGARQVVDFLCQCRARVGGPAIVIWDNSGTHTSKRTKRFFEETGWERIQLPAYCPELNADENVWNWTKHTDLANTSPRDHSELLASVQASLRRLARQPKTLRWCIKNTDLNWPSGQ